MNGRIIRALIEKDAKLYFRDRFFALVTVLALVVYIVIYMLMPSSVDESFEIALYADETPSFLTEFLANDGITYASLDSEEAVRNAVEDNDYAAGLLVPATIDGTLDAGESATMTLVLPADAPQERNDAITTLFASLGYAFVSEPLDIQINQEIIGEDRVGRQISARDRMIPLFAIFLLITETMGLASLVSREIQERTIQALLVSPTQLIDLFTAKGIFGVVLAFSQAAILMTLTGSLNHNPLLILFTLLLGALLVTGVGFLLASVAKDLLEISAWSILVFVIFSLPAFSVLFPGTISTWIQIIPTYPLVDTMHQVVNFEAGWSDVWGNLITLFAFSVALLTTSIFVLERKFR